LARSGAAWPERDSFCSICAVQIRSHASWIRSCLFVLRRGFGCQKSYPRAADGPGESGRTKLRKWNTYTQTGTNINTKCTMHSHVSCHKSDARRMPGVCIQHVGIVVSTCGVATQLASLYTPSASAHLWTVLSAPSVPKQPWFAPSLNPDLNVGRAAVKRRRAHLCTCNSEAAVIMGIAGVETQLEIARDRTRSRGDMHNTRTSTPGR
jgi:hypothetical protein